VSHKERVQQALEQNPEGMTFGQMRQVTQLGARDVGRAVDRLETDGLVETVVDPQIGPEFPLWRMKRGRSKKKGGDAQQSQPG
jgi:hypothetical protein